MKRIIFILTVICVVCALAAGILLLVTGKTKAPSFIPPTFDEKSVDGTPQVPEGLGWHEIYKTGMSFRASVCGEIIIENKTAKIYFFNPEENTLWLKLRILNEKGEILGETGLLKPGQYLTEITFDTLPKNGEKIVLKLMSYQPETYYSGGSVSLNTVARFEEE